MARRLKRANSDPTLEKTITMQRIQVAIIGTGPAGLLLGPLLACVGIDNIELKRQSGDYVLKRSSAGVLKQTTCDLLDVAGIGARMYGEGMPHGGIELCSEGRRHRIDPRGLTDGKQVVVYGQTEVTRVLVAACATSGALTVYRAAEVALHDFDAAAWTARVTYTHDGELPEIHCDFIAGCDGYHGVSRASVPPNALSVYEKVYQVGWLVVLADTLPVSHELIYSNQ